MRPLGDDQLDRRGVYAQQCVELTRTKGRGLVLSCGDQTPSLEARTHLFGNKHREDQRVFW